jgi:hypothetical protein
VRSLALRLVFTASAAALLGACGAPDVGYALIFPSEETFLVSENARVEIYDGTGIEAESPDAICRALSVGRAAPVATLDSTGLRGVCDFRAGLAIPQVPVSRLVFFAEAIDAAGTSMLRGCSVVDVSASLPASCDTDDDCPASYGCRTRLVGGEPLDVCVLGIQLATLPNYPAEPDLSSCPNQETKCTGGC